MFVLEFSCEITLAESKGNDKFNSLYNNDRIYANFCTGFYLMLEHRWKEAIKVFKNALEINPQAVKIHNYLATCYFQVDEKDKALFHIEKVAQLKPGDFGIHYTLGSIYENEGEEKKAVSEYEWASGCVTEEIDEVFVTDMLHRLANLYLKNNDLEKAVDSYKKILDAKLTNEPARIHYKLGQIYFAKKRIEDAIEEFVKTRNYDLNFESISFYIASCYEELKDYDKAINELTSYIERHTDAWFMRISLSNVYEKIREHEMAELEREKVFGILRKSINSGSGNLREYIVLSQLFQNKGKNKKAIETLKEAITNVNVSEKNNEALKEIHLLMANVYYEMNEYENVVNELEKVLQIDPDCHQASNFLGYFFVERGENLNKALSLIEKALSFEPKNGAYLDSLGWAYYKMAAKDDQGKLVLALQKLTEALKYAEDPEIVGHIGDVYYCLGFWKEAQKQWENALRLWAKAAEGLPTHLIHENSHELRARKMISKKLEKLNHLRIVENSKKGLKSGEIVVSNRSQ